MNLKFLYRVIVRDARSHADLLAPKVDAFDDQDDAERHADTIAATLPPTQYAAVIRYKPTLCANVYQTKPQDIARAFARHGFAIDGETYTRMNGTAEEIIRSADLYGSRPESIGDMVELEIIAYGTRRKQLTAAALIEYLDAHGGDTPTGDD